MLRPKAMQDDEKNMSVEIRAEKDNVTLNILFNKKISDTEADAAVDTFNAKWLAAGGSFGATLIHRDKVPPMLMK